MMTPLTITMKSSCAPAALAEDRPLRPTGGQSRAGACRNRACGMRLRVQVVIEADDDDDHQAPAVHEVAQIDREALSVDTLGLQLEEAKHLLEQVQAVVAEEQVRTSLAQQVACPSCGRARAHKDAHPIVLRTLFGTPHLRSPRWRQCPCQPQT